MEIRTDSAADSISAIYSKDLKLYKNQTTRHGNKKSLNLRIHHSHLYSKDLKLY